MGISTSATVRSETQNSRAVQFFSTDAVAAAATTFNFGFVPDVVRFVNLTDRIQDEWFAGMPAAYALHTVAAGAVTYVTTGGITVATAATAAGVNEGDITIPAALMVASKDFVIIAETV